MPKRSDDWGDLRARVLGLGERSLRKSYYPALQERMDELERMRALLDHSHEAFVFVEIETERIWDANDASCRIIELPLESLRGRSVDGLISPEVVARLREVKQGGRDAGPEELLQVVHESPSGARHELEVSVATNTFSEGTFAIIVARDISERLRAVDALAASREQLHHAQKLESVGRLAGGIAHDFNNLLGAILGYADLVLATLPEDDPVREDIEEIAKAGERASRLTRQLLAFSRRQKGRPGPVDLVALVRGMQNMVARLLGSDIDLNVRCVDSPVVISSDRGQMEQVLLNLAVNARDAMPEGGRLLLRVDRQLGLEGSSAVLTVSDTGVGMDEETRQRIFEPFFTTKATGKGTGLGLSTVYGAVSSAGGEILVESAPGEGTTFRLRFPVVATSMSSETKSAAAPTPQQSGTETILVVDDEEMLRHFVSRVLAAQGYQVVKAADGEDALAVLERHDGEVDLIVTDVVMPRLGGAALVERVRQEFPQLPVVFMSGLSDRATLPDGEWDTLAKPFGRKELVTTVRRALDRPVGL